MSRSDWNRPDRFSAPEGRRRIKLVLSYNGACYYGWQKQAFGPSVQEEIEKAVKKITSLSDDVVLGSGRTDSGVNAYGQVAHIETSNYNIPAKAFYLRLNQLLPLSIRIRSAEDVDSSFHCRFSAMAREYRFFIKEKNSMNAFDEGKFLFINNFPDINLLNSYATEIVGTHDFTTFCGSGDMSESHYRDMYESSFSYEEDIFGNKVLVYKICGNAFLYRMVRSITGTLLWLAQKNGSVSDFKEILDSKDRQKAGPTAKPNGLYLWRISYNPEEYQWFEEKYGKRRS